MFFFNFFLLFFLFCLWVLKVVKLCNATLEPGNNNLDEFLRVWMWCLTTGRCERAYFPVYMFKMFSYLVYLSCCLLWFSVIQYLGFVAKNDNFSFCWMVQMIEIQTWYWMADLKLSFHMSGVWCFSFFFFYLSSELLRRSAEQTLMDMVQLLFSRWDNLLNIY